MIKVLLSNDDGYLAPGLQQLKLGLHKLARVYVLAPRRDRSACSSSLNTRERIYCGEHTTDHFYCNGTSATCAHLGINGFFGFTPDMVISGINCGANMGDDALYSGTLAAALEGRFLPTTSMAISLVYSNEPQYYDTAATVAAMLIHKIGGWDLPPGLVLNVNVPDLPMEEIRGWRSTRLGHRERSSSIRTKTDERGMTYYHLGWMGNGQYDHPHAHPQSRSTLTDFEAVANHMISVTPICADMTFIEGLGEVGSQLDQMPATASQ